MFSYIEKDETFMEIISFSDQVKFYICRTVNRHKYCLSEIKMITIMKHVVCLDDKLNLLALFEEPVVTCGTFLAVTGNTGLPHALAGTVFQLNSVTTHFSNYVQVILSMEFLY